MTDRALVFERFLDDLELYFDCKRDLNRKKKAAYEADADRDLDGFWQLEDTLEVLRDRARRALDEYVDSLPTGVDTEQDGS